jgi:hypothetical protein
MKVIFFHDNRTSHVNLPVIPRVGEVVSFHYSLEKIVSYQVKAIRLALTPGPPVKAHAYEIILDPLEGAPTPRSRAKPSKGGRTRKASPERASRTR